MPQCFVEIERGCAHCDSAWSEATHHQARGVQCGILSALTNVLAQRLEQQRTRRSDLTTEHDHRRIHQIDDGSADHLAEMHGHFVEQRQRSRVSLLATTDERRRDEWQIVGIDPTFKADAYAEVAFPGATGSLPPAGSLTTVFPIQFPDNAPMTQTNDYSFDATATDDVHHNRIPVYFDGVLIYGTPPGQ